MGAAEHELLEGLSHAGYRLTRARRVVVEVLAAKAVHLSAEELLAELWQAGERISRASVYRALGALEQAGLVERVGVPRGPARFELIEPGADGSRQSCHFICGCCGRVIDVASRRVRSLQQAAQRQVDLPVETCQVRLIGLCDQCRTKDGAGK